MRLAAVDSDNAWIVLINQQRLYLGFYNESFQNHQLSSLKWYINVNSVRRLKY